jgi:hypothetical protein
MGWGSMWPLHTLGSSQRRMGMQAPMISGKTIAIALTLFTM